MLEPKRNEMNRNETTMGVTDPKSVDIAFHAAIGAVGEWSHLALFPAGHRAVMAARCGVRPGLHLFERYRLFMVSDARLAKLAYRFSEKRRELAVWETADVEDGERGLTAGVVAAMPEGTVVVGRTPQFLAGLAEQDGWCYLTMPTADGSPLPDLGRYPTVEKLVARGVSIEVLMGLRFVRPGLLHYAPVDGVAVGGAGLPLIVEPREMDPPVQAGAAEHEVVAFGSGGLHVRPVAMRKPMSLLQRFSGQPDFTVCKCAVHVSVDDVVPGVTCAQAVHALHPVLKAAREKGEAVCHATPEVRELDRQMLSIILGGPPSVRPAYAVGTVPEQVRSLLASNRVPVESFGPGYCYQQVVRGNARWRVARLLGPAPLCSDLEMVLPWVGAKCFRRCRLVEVAPHIYHVDRESDSETPWEGAGSAFSKALRAVVRADPGARVGVDPSVLVRSVAPAGGWRDQPAVERDMQIALTAAASLSGTDKVRKRMLEAVGDAALTLECSKQVIRKGGTAQDYQELRSQRLSNKALSAAFEAIPAYPSFGLPENSRGTVTSAKACEGVVGVLSFWVGEAGVAAYAAQMRLFE